jgi:hypothetical protein
MAVRARVSRRQKTTARIGHRITMISTSNNAEGNTICDGAAASTFNSHRDPLEGSAFWQQ